MDMYTIEANTLTEADLPELNRLTADLGKGKPREHTWELFRQINENAVVYVARRQHDNDLAGMGVLNVDYKAPPPFFGNLQAFAVLPEHRGNGVFGKLLDAIEQHARDLELGVIALQCTKHRRRVAFREYKKRGYHEIVPFSGIMIGKPEKLGRRKR